MVVEDDEVVLQPTAHELSSLGTIRLGIQAVIVSNLRTQQKFNRVSLPGDNPVSEKVKKAGAHSARYDVLPFPGDNSRKPLSLSDDSLISLGQSMPVVTPQMVTTRDLRGYQGQGNLSDSC